MVQTSCCVLRTRIKKAILGGRMKKYIVRMYCLVECQVDAESIEDVTERVCDLNQFDINQIPHQITEIDDVVEVEEM